MRFCLFCPALQVTLCWSTTGWSSPPKTGTTTTRRTTAPPSTTAPGGTATATRPTWTASTCAGSTPPTRTASSGPPGLAGSTRSSFLRWRFGPLVIWKTNESVFVLFLLAHILVLSCSFTQTFHTDLRGFSLDDLILAPLLLLLHSSLHYPSPWPLFFPTENIFLEHSVHKNSTAAFRSCGQRTSFTQPHKGVPESLPQDKAPLTFSDLWHAI